MDRACFGDDRIWPRRAAQSLLCLTLLVAAVALVGQLSGPMLLATYGDGYIAMAPATSVFFIALAAAPLIALRPAAGPVAHFCAVVIGLLVAACGGIVGLAPLGTGSNNPAAEWVATTPVMGVYPLSLMSPFSGALFAMAGAALASLVGGHARGAGARSWLHATAALGSLVAGMAALVGISYAIDAPLLYDRPTIPMALPTAIAFVLLGCGLLGMALICAPDHGRWTSRLADLSVTSQLRAGLTAIVLAVLAFAHVVNLQKDMLWQQAETLYKHPLTVIRLTGELRADAWRIRGTLRDLAHASDSREIQRLTQDLDAHRATVRTTMTQLARDYLGPRADIAALNEELRQWLLASENLTRPATGVAEDAAAPARRVDEDATLTLRAIDRMDVIKDFALGKAEQLFREAERRHRAVDMTILVSLAAVLLVSSLVGWLVSQQILRPVEELTSVAAQFGAEKLDVRSKSVSANEFGVLASTFNQMADTIEAGVRATALLNEQLRRSEASLAAQNRELDAFSYSVSHDLRAPLRSIDGFSRILLEDYDARLDAEGRDSLRRIRAAAQLMAQLIDDLLRLSRLSRGELHHEDVDLSAMAREIAAELSAQEPERRVTWVVAEGVAARGDRQLLRVALTNLLGNAWKFTGRRADARIEFGSEMHDGRHQYFVRDNGVGFDPTYADKLFGAFQRLHSKTEFAGTGIGLATVQRVVRRHGGNVRAQGAVDQGATFSFDLDTQATTT